MTNCFLWDVINSCGLQKPKFAYFELWNDAEAALSALYFPKVTLANLETLLIAQLLVLGDLSFTSVRWLAKVYVSRLKRRLSPSLAQ